MQPLAAIQASAFPRPLSAGAVAGRLEAFLSVGRDVPGEYWTAEHFLADRPGKWEFSRAVFDPADPEKVLAYAFASRPEPSLVHLHHLMVACDHRGRGLDRQLLTELSHRAALAGAAHLRLKVHPANQRAAAFYLREGFQVVGEENGYKVMTSPVRLLQRRVGIHQPNFLPWLGYFYKMARADCFVFADSLAFSKGSYTQRVKIKTAGGPRWLTAPLLHTGYVGQVIRDVRCGGWPDWRQRLVNAIKGNYLQCPHYRCYGPAIDAILMSGEDRLAELNMQLIKYIAGELEIRTPLVTSSEMKLPPKDDPTEWIISVCKEVGATVFLSGRGGASYQDESAYARAGIQLVYTDFQHPTYPQAFGEFVPGLSIVDLLFNCGPESAHLFGL